MCDSITEYEGCTDHVVKIGMHMYSLCASILATNASMSHGKFMRGLGMCILLASVASAPCTREYLAYILTKCSACS